MQSGGEPLHFLLPRLVTLERRLSGGVWRAANRWLDMLQTSKNKNYNSVNVIKRIVKNLLTTYIGRGKEMIFLAIDFLSNKEMSKKPIICFF